MSSPASFDLALHHWDDGVRRVRSADPAVRPALEAVSDRILRELRRRLGGPFTTQELADLYAKGTDWCLELAIETAPDTPAAWEGGAAAEAAFARYVREASDFAGGRRVEPQDE